MENTLTVKRQQNGQMEMTELKRLPTLAELITEDEGTMKQNALMVLLNQPPPQSWLKEHPMTKGSYLPIERVEYLLSRIFTVWSVEVKDCKVVANSMVVTVRLHVRNPITGETMWQDGIGASPIQTDKGQGAMDWNHAKADGVMKSAPAAESYAIKDAAEKLGKLFGKDLNRKDEISYTELLKTARVVSFEDVRELYHLKKDNLTKAEVRDAERILENKEEKSYFKLQQMLSTK